MKNLFLTIAVMLIGTFSFASSEIVFDENLNSSENLESSFILSMVDNTIESITTLLAECCTVTVSGGDGDATITKCRTTYKEACDAAYAAAFAATE